MASGTRLQRWILGGAIAALALYCDNASLGSSRSYYQEALWTLILVGAFLVELRKTLSRIRAACLASLLLCLHFYFIYLKQDAFPFHSSLFVILCASIEFAILVILYLRLCQAIDPDGPFGLTEAEKVRRRVSTIRLTKR